ncbi:hypothetical protein [Kozakia baliensis]|nr:hypothetical protein [Kozakia baliensis]
MLDSNCVQRAEFSRLLDGLPPHILHQAARVQDRLNLIRSRESIAVRLGNSMMRDIWRKSADEAQQELEELLLKGRVSTCSSTVEGAIVFYPDGGRGYFIPKASRPC